MEFDVEKKRNTYWVTYEQPDTEVIVWDEDGGQINYITDVEVELDEETLRDMIDAIQKAKAGE